MAVQSRLSNGATLLRITGDASADVQERIYRWLSRPVVAAHFDGRITAAESASLRDDIARAVDRLWSEASEAVLLPGHVSDRYAVPSTHGPSHR